MESSELEDKLYKISKSAEKAAKDMKELVINFPYFTTAPVSWTNGVIEPEPTVMSLGEMIAEHEKHYHKHLEEYPETALIFLQYSIFDRMIKIEKDHC